MGYTAEEVDTLVVRLEKNVERQLATLDSAVKGRAAERDLLSTAEATRDLLLKAVKGEKEKLDQVFGGSCERIGRLRRCLDPPKFSDMHKKDPRWENLRAVIETVEAVLNDMGTFKPWVPPEVKAIEKVYYRGFRRRMSPGRAVQMRPEIDGGEVESFEVSPALPEGLELDAATGLIHGTLQPGKLVDEATYVVTAKNEAGQVQTELVFAVKDTPPVGVSYPTARDCIIVGQAISWAPATECGDSSNWSVSPDLPVGLVLEPGSGKIVGTATEITDAKSYEISATNSGGKATVTLTLEVKAGRPKAPMYPMSEEGLVLHVGEAFEVAPEDCGADVTFSISPSLPSGLHLDEVTGVISGTPQEEADLMDYEVTVSNMSGSEAASFPLTVRPEKPHDLRYPDLAESYQVGDTVSLQAEVQGMVKDFVVVPALPEGLSIDGATGEISGTLQSLCDLSTHTVTASSEEGKATAELKFTVVVSAPSNFTYPMASPSYAAGEPIDLEAEIEGSNCSFTVEPALPEGISLDGTTGQITGTPLGECPETTYTLTATNSSGSTSTSLTFQVEEVQTVDAEGIDQNFAEMLEAIEDLADMVEEPSKVKSFGDWMIWMVHRAHLNDPTLTDFNFNNLHMPPAHLEARIAPKLAKAMANNTHIHTLSLVNSNLQKAEGTVLAQSLALNSSVVQVHLENNCLDSTSVQAFATALLQNPSSKLETLRFSPQKGTGNFFGRPAEEAFGQLLEKNEIILRLGLNCNDAHWRNHINRALLRNNDFARRRRKKQAGGEEEEVQAEEKSLRRVVLTTPPSTSGSLAKDGPQNAVRGFVVAHHKFPTPSQLQNYAKANGSPLKYSEVAPAVRDFRAAVLDVAKGTKVTVADAFEVDVDGIMKSWSIENDKWMLDIWVEDKRFNYKSMAGKEVALSISDGWAAWLEESGSGGYP